MKRSTALIGIGTLLLNPLRAITTPSTKIKTPKEYWDKYLTGEHYAFAYKCIQYGEDNYKRGHTLAGVGWMESWFNSDIDHKGESSRGPFGIKPETAIATITDKYRKWEVPYGLKIIKDKYVPSDIEALLDEDFKFSADMCLAILYDNTKYFELKGWGSSAAWRYGYQRYNAGYNWKKKHGRGMIFSERVGFLRRSVVLPKVV